MIGTAASFTVLSSSSFISYPVVRPSTAHVFKTSQNKSQAMNSHFMVLCQFPT
jgi:hypothetical protein